MSCLACARAVAVSGRLCSGCAADFPSGGERRLDGGVLVCSAYSHRGTARLLVHRLKYDGQSAAAALLAAAMAAVVPAGATALVPVPRARLRRWRYGVDPALELAGALSRVLNLPVLRVLEPEWWHRRRAGPAGVDRGIPRFRARRRPPPGAVLVDDVVTTGATLRAAAGALGGAWRAVTATTALAGTSPAAPAGPGYSERKPPWGIPTTGECVPPGTHRYRVLSSHLSARCPWAAPEDRKGGHGGGSRSR